MRAWHRVYRLHRVVAAALEFAHHQLDFVLFAAQRRYRGALDERHGAGRVVLVYLVHRYYELFRRGGVAYAPACHRVCFREAVKRHRALRHSGKRGDARLLLPVVDEALVNFVGYDEQVVFLRKRGYPLELCARQDAARRVARREQDYSLGARRYLRAHLLKARLEAVLLGQRVGDGLRAEERGDVEVIYPDGVGYQQLVALVEHRAEQVKDRLRQPRRHEHVLRRAGDAVRRAQTLRYRLAQLRHAEVRGVEHLAVAQALHRRLFYVGWRIEVRTAYFKMNDALSRALHRERLFVDLAYARRRERADPRGGEISHISFPFP